MRLLKVCAVLVTLVLAGAYAAGAGADVYWTNNFGESIGHANLDGSNVNQSYRTTPGATPYGVAADGHYLYAVGEHLGVYAIARANLDGSDPYEGYVVGLDGPGPLALDNHYLYWLNADSGTCGDTPTPIEIGRVGLNGTGVTAGFISVSSACLQSYGFLGGNNLAVAGGYVYWIDYVPASDQESDEYYVGRASTSGTGVDPTYIDLGDSDKASNYFTAYSLAVQGGYIYWTQSYFGGDGVAVGSIGRVGVTGSGLDSSFITDLPGTASGLAVGPQNIYWTLENTSMGGGAVGLAAANGSGVTEFATGDDDDPDAITLDRRIVVNSAGDGADANPGDGFCATNSGSCTLRAAIQEANADAFTTPTNITFNIPGVPANTLPTISPATPLPAVTVPVDIDATGQPGAYAAPGGQTIGAILDGTSAGTTADGLQLAQGAAGSTINGLQIQNFADVGVVLGDSSEQVAGSVLYGDGSGVEVGGTGDTIGSGAGLPGDIFFKDGSLSKMVSFLQSNAGQKLTPGQVTQSEVGAGAGILMDRASAGTQVTGDVIGVHGPGFDSSSPDSLPADGWGAALESSIKLNNAPDVSPFGIMIGASGGADISGVTISGDFIAGTLFGVAAGTDSSSTISGLTLTSNHLGDEPGGSPLDPLGLVLGVAAGGNVTGLTLGSPGSGNRFDDTIADIVLSGTGVASPVVQANTFGQAQTLSSLSSFGTYNLIGVLLADIPGAQIGGTGAGQSNALNGAGLGVILSGTKDSNDTIADNTFGSATFAPFSGGFPDDSADYYGALGVSDIGGSGPPNAGQNLTITGNTFQNMVGGTLLSNVNGITLTSNVYNGNEFSALIDAQHATIGVPGAGNLFDNSGFGLLLADTNPTTQEDQQAGVSANQSSQTNPYLSENGEDLVLDDADEDSTANLTTTSFNTPTQTDGSDTIMGNSFGVNASGAAAPDALPVLIIDEPALQFGGTGAGQGNIVEDNLAGGLLVAGNTSTQILGNTIYNNESFTTGVTALAGLGINLVGGSFDSGLGVNPQDPIQPDTGPNNNQNSPVLSSAVTSGSTLTLTGTLHGVASTNYVIEVYADQNQNPFGAGEGETLLGRLNLTTDASGNASFSAQFGAPGSTYRYISSTATTVPASGPGVTSEFSVNVPIATTVTTPSTGGSSSTGGSGSGSGAAAQSGSGTVTPAASTSVAGGGGSISVSGVKPGQTVTVPVTATCSSATSTPCTVTTTGTASATVSAAASAARAKAKAKRTTILSGVQVVAAGGSAKLRLRLTKPGAKLLQAKHSLTVTLTTTISGPGRQTLTHTVTLRLTLKLPASKRRVRSVR